MLASHESVLAGVGVLVTRPAGQAEGLSHLVEAAGGEVYRAPLLEILPLEAEAGAALPGDAATWDWVVFVSANAVRFASDSLEQWASRSPVPKIAAIGPATVAELEKIGLVVDLVPKQQSNSEALLEEEAFAAVAGKRILIVRGEGGREVLAEALRSRGAEVVYAEVYRRVKSQLDWGALADWLRKDAPRVLTFTSAEALEHFTKSLTATDREASADVPTVVIGDRLADLAISLGWQNVVAAGAGDQALYEAILGLVAPRPRLLKESNSGEMTVGEDLTEATPESEVPTEFGESGGSYESQPPAPKKSRFGAWIGYSILLLVLILVGGGVFILQELRSKQEGLGSGLDKGDKQMQELLHQISGLQTELAAVHAQLATLQAEVSTEDSKFERELGQQGTSLEEKLDTTKTELGGSIRHIQEQLNKSRGDLMVADAEYLLSIANQKLHLVGDVKAVLAAMEAADQRLHDSGDPAVFKVREALAEEINLLKGFNPPDIVGTSAKLLALEGKVHQLPTLLPHAGRTKEDHELPKAPDGSEDGGSFLDSAIDEVKGLVTVRRTDLPLRTVLLPEEVEVLREELMLKFEIARAALFRGDDGLFKENLNAAEVWIHEHFDRDAALTQGVLGEIKQLQQLQLQVPFPNVSKSLTLIRSIEKLRTESEKAGISPKSAGSPPAPVKAQEEAAKPAANTPEATKITVPRESEMLESAPPGGPAKLEGGEKIEQIKGQEAP